MPEDTTFDSYPEEKPYYTVEIPAVPFKLQTPWHPIGPDHPYYLAARDEKFQTIVRGSFKTKEDALTWGKDNLNGMPYSVKLIVP